MRVYVASAWSNASAARAAMDAIAAAGHVITFDWTLGTFDLAPAAHWAERDLEGVRTAHAVVFLADDRARGALVEFGAAMALEKRVIVVGTACDAIIFMHHPAAVRVADLDDAIRELEEVTEVPA